MPQAMSSGASPFRSRSSRMGSLSKGSASGPKPCEIVESGAPKQNATPGAPASRFCAKVVRRSILKFSARLISVCKLSTLVASSFGKYPCMTNQSCQRQLCCSKQKAPYANGQHGSGHWPNVSKVPRCRPWSKRSE